MKVRPSTQTLKQPPRPHARSSLRVLLADDDPVNQVYAEALVRSLGHVPVLVVNGEDAVRAWRVSEYDLILMDCHMPVMDGFTATRTIRAEETSRGRGRTPIIAMTSSPMVRDCREAGMDSMLRKPFGRGDLADVTVRVVG